MSIATIRSIILAGVLLSFSRPVSLGQTRPDLSTQISNIVHDFSASDSLIRKQAHSDLKKLPAEALPQLFAILDDPQTDPELKKELSDPINNLHKKLSQIARKQRFQSTLDWNLQTCLDAYDKFGTKNPLWDNLVRDGFKTYNDLGGDEHNMTILHYQKAIAFFQKAYTAGCRDPLLIQFYGVSLSHLPQTDSSKLRALASEAYNAIHASQYPPMRKLLLYNWYSRVLAGAHQPDSVAQDEALRRQLFEEAIALWPDAMATPNLNISVVYDAAYNLILYGTQLHCGTEETYKIILPPFQKVFPNDSFTYLFQGIVLHDLAADIRGGDTPDRITDYQARQTNSYLTQSHNAFMKAWRLDPTNPNPPTCMIGSSAEDSPEQHERDQWFFRAMNANPDNIQACNNELSTLSSEDEYAQFATFCLATQNWRGRIPLSAVTAHEKYAQDSGEGDAYLSKPRVWSDIQNAYEGTFKVLPDDYRARSHYLKLACRTNHWKIADTQAQAIGNFVKATEFTSQAEFNYLRRKIAQNLKASATQPERNTNSSPQP